LKEQLTLLIELQTLDLAISSINNRKSELPEKIDKLDQEFSAFVSSVDEERNKLDELNKRHKEKEDKLKKGVETLRKTKDRLLEVKTNKEYQAILKEIETIESKNGESEDEIIVALDELDQVRNQLKSKEKDLDAFKAQYEQSKKNMEGELNTLNKDLLGCQQKSSAIAKKIQEPLFKRYEIIKSKKNGLAVVSVWKEVCNGCHMNMPPQLYNELQRCMELMFCPNCNRMIYWTNQGKEDG